MKILSIDRDTLYTQLIRTRLEESGHVVLEDAVKNNALERLEKEEFDAVILDPAPLNNARPLVISVRRAAKKYPYVILSSQSMDEEEAMRSGANDLLAKPMDGTKLTQMIINAERLTKLVERINDDSEDFPSAGGVIAKSAFNQLFLSALDRADRYGEKSHLLFIRIQNHKDIMDQEGQQVAQMTSAQLSKYLVRLRRQSDIIAQTGKGEYVLLLQRSLYDTEPMEAAARFADALTGVQEIGAHNALPPELVVELLSLPSGGLLAEHKVPVNTQQP